MNIEKIMYAIEKTDAAGIDDLLDAVIRRKRILYPDWEIIYYARKKEKEEDMKTLMDILIGGREEQ